MSRNQSSISPSGCILLLLILANIALLKYSYVSGDLTPGWSLISIALLIIAMFNIRQDKYPFLRDYPLVGYFYYALVALRGCWHVGSHWALTKYKQLSAPWQKTGDEENRNG